MKFYQVSYGIFFFSWVSCGPQAATVKVSSVEDENQKESLISASESTQTSSYLSSSLEKSSSSESISSIVSSLVESHSSKASVQEEISKYIVQKENSLEVLFLEEKSWKNILVEKGAYESEAKVPSYDKVIKSSDYVLWNTADFDGDGSYEWIFLPRTETGVMIVWNVEEKNGKYLVEKAWKVVLPQAEKVNLLGVAHLSSQSLLLYHTGLKLEEKMLMASSVLLETGVLKESLNFKNENGDSYLFKESFKDASAIMLLENEQKGKKVLQWVMKNKSHRIIVQPFGKLLENKSLEKSYQMNDIKGYFVSAEILYPQGMVRSSHGGILDGSLCKDKKCVWKKYKTEWNAQGRVQDWVELERIEFPEEFKNVVKISF